MMTSKQKKGKIKACPGIWRKGIFCCIIWVYLLFSSSVNILLLELFEEEWRDKMKRRYRVNPSLKHYVRRVLIRSFYSCKMREDEAGTLWCYTNASSDTFHKVVQRARCEKRTKETGIFFVTTREANNPIMMEELDKMHPGTGVQIIDDKDGTRILN